MQTIEMQCDKTVIEVCSPNEALPGKLRHINFTVTAQQCCEAYSK